MKVLTAKDIGTNTKRADVLAADDERIFWQKGVFGVSNGEQPLHTFFYYCGIFFWLEGERESSSRFQEN